MSCQRLRAFKVQLKLTSLTDCLCSEEQRMSTDETTTAPLRGEHKQACCPQISRRVMGLERTPFSLSVRSAYQKIGGLAVLLCLRAASALAQAKEIPAH